MSALPALIDVAFNITDEAFAGQKDNPPDYEQVLQRARAAGVSRFIVCGGSLADSIKALDLCEKLDPTREYLFLTVGVHPTRCNEFLPSLAEGAENPNATTEPGVAAVVVAPSRCGVASASPEEHAAALEALIQANPERVVGYGEFGLDYDREHFCDRPTQQRFFAMQLEIVKKLDLTMYLHLRGEGCAADLFRIMREKLGEPAAGKGYRGVVHSFTGTEAELQEVLDFGLDVGINGCSLKTEENCNVAAQIPLDRLHLETDCPYCDIRPTHFSHKFVQTKFAMTKKFELGKMWKSRNEPARTVEVAEVIAGLKKCSVAEVANAATANTLRLFKKMVRR